MPGSATAYTGPKSHRARSIQKPLGDEYHVYSVIWRPHEIIFFIDGLETYRETRPEVLEAFQGRTLKMRISTAMSNFFKGSGPGLDARSYSSEMSVDYVRHYVEN